MENALIFNIGDETRPKVEDLSEQENYEKSFFFDIYEKAFALINEIRSDSIQDNDKLKGFQRERNNIIAFIGGRGTGKTSCMQTIYQSLENDTCKNKLINCSNDEFLTLPTIDPTYFEEKSNILEIIIARMFHQFKEHAATPYASRGQNDSTYLEYKNDLARKFQKVKNSLDTINSKSNSSNDSIEELSNLASGINLREHMIELIRSYLKYAGKKYLAIAIDDIDLQTRYAYKMVEQIRRYFIIPNVIILMGIKLIQLTDLIKQTYYQEYKDLIDKERLSDTVENMTGRYLSKLIPYNHRIFLPEVETKFHQKLIISKEHKNIHTFNSINSGVLQLIFHKTRYLFYDSDIKSSLIIPRNLRDLLSIISLVYYMEEIPASDKQAIRHVVHKNRIIFKNYFMDTWCCEHLPTDMFAFIRELDTLEASSINKSIIDFLSKKCDGKIRHDERITYNSNRCYNMALSDVDYFLDKISNNFEIPYINQFVFALKTIYSMFLYEFFEEKEEDWIFRKDILRERLGENTTSTSTKHILKKINKLMLFSNYEKILGGNILRVADLYPKDTAGNRGNYTSKYIHIRRINHILLNSLYTYATSSGEEKENQAFTIEKDLAFHIWEFFTFTTYIRTSNPYFRSQKRCYYDTFLLPSSADLEYDTIYSSTSILFNMVKYYNHYRLYYLLTLDPDYSRFSKHPFMQVWEKIYRRGRRSIIYQILYTNNLDLTDKVEKRDRFENTSLEKLFIRNMEILDNLQDFLPFLKSTVKVHNSKSIEAIVTETLDILINFYKQLEKFSFYLYPKDLELTSENLKINFQALSPLVDLLEDVKASPEARSIFWKIYYNEDSPKQQ